MVWLVFALGVGVVVLFFCLALTAARLGELSRDQKVLWQECIRVSDRVRVLREDLGRLEEQLDYGRRVTDEPLV
jgi:hypothetical protein